MTAARYLAQPHVIATLAPLGTADADGWPVTRVVLDNYMNPPGKAAYLSTLYWAYENNCAIALTGDMPTKKDLKSLDYMTAQEFTSTVLQARYYLWVTGWMPR